MAINDPNYRYATQTWEADGVRTQYDIAFDGGYIRQSDVVAFSVLVDEATGLTTDRQIHPVVFLSESVDPETEWKTAQVQITPAVPAGRRVVIFRSTEKSAALVNYTNGSILTEKNLDLANDQSVFGIAEIMDGLNAARIDINAQVQEVVNLNELIQEVYEQVLVLLASGGIVSVDPRTWAGDGDGSQTDFPIIGADVDGAGFYDVYVDSLGLEPDTDYSIIMGESPADTQIRFVTAPADGTHWFAVLRGYAKPYTGPPPITSLRVPIRDTSSTSYFFTYADEYALVRSLSNTPATFNMPEIPAVGTNKFGSGSFLSVKQHGTGQVTLMEDGDTILHIPAGCLPKTRAQNSVVTLTCENADTNEWLVSGDLAKEV